MFSTPSDRPECGRPALGRELDPIAVRPDARVLGEIRCVEAAAVVVAKQSEGRDGKGLAQTSSPILAAGSSGGANERTSSARLRH